MIRFRLSVMRVLKYVLCFFTAFFFLYFASQNLMNRNAEAGIRQEKEELAQDSRDIEDLRQEVKERERQEQTNRNRNAEAGIRQEKEELAQDSRDIEDLRQEVKERERQEQTNRNRIAAAGIGQKKEKLAQDSRNRNAAAGIGQKKEKLAQDSRNRNAGAGIIQEKEKLAQDSRHFKGYKQMDDSSLSAETVTWDIENDMSTLNFSSRRDVITNTTWGAPIIWEKMFDPHIYDRAHKIKGSSVALTVFAVGRYLDAYLTTFMNSAEQHFMLGLPVSYYIFTDKPEKVPNIKLGPTRTLKVIKVNSPFRWQDISMMRMKLIADTIETDIRHHFTHVFCFDVDQIFTGRFGSEALGDSVAQLHAHYYTLPPDRFTYDRNPKSKAYMEKGDFYYHAAVFGGTWKSVKAITETCHENIMEDKKNNVEALWHDESHLNKYLWLHKPSRLLSPEYCWHAILGYPSYIQVVRLRWAPKYYEKLRAP